MSSVCCWWNKSIGSKFSVVPVVLQKVHLKWRIDVFCIFLTEHPSSCKYSAAIAVLKNYLLKQTDFLSNWCFAHFFEKRSQFQVISELSLLCEQVFAQTAQFLVNFMSSARFWQKILTSNKQHSCAGCFSPFWPKTAYRCFLHIFDKPRQLRQIYSWTRCLAYV